jgi:hypothetical protein
LKRLYGKVKEKDVEEKVKILHEDEIIDCFLLTELVVNTLIRLSLFFTQKNVKEMLTFLSYKENIYFDDKQIEKILRWLKNYKNNHKNKKASSIDNTKKE